MRVSYDLLYYRPGDLDYIQDPSGLLFDLIALFQENYGALSQEEKDISIEILGYKNERDWEDPLQESNIIMQIIESEDSAGKLNSVSWSVPFKKLDRSLLERQVCAVLPVMDCGLGAAKETYLYITENDDHSGNSLMVTFGAIPGSRYSPYPFLRPLQGREKQFRKVTVKRSEMNMYFDSLLD